MGEGGGRGKPFFLYLRRRESFAAVVKTKKRYERISSPSFLSPSSFSFFSFFFLYDYSPVFPVDLCVFVYFLRPKQFFKTNSVLNKTNSLGAIIGSECLMVQSRFNILNPMLHGH